MKNLNKINEMKVASIYLMANVFNKAIAFVTIPVFSRLLSTSEYGDVSTYSSAVLIMQYIMGLSSEYTVRNAYVDFKDEVPKYMSAMYLLTAIWSVLISVAVLGVNYIFNYTGVVICICLLIQSFMTYANNAMSNKLMMDENYPQRAVLLAGPNLLSAIMGIVLIYVFSDNKAYGRILGYVLSVSLFGIYNILQSWHRSKPKAELKYWTYILKISPPLIIHGLSVIALSQIDRIMLTSMRTSSETGIYSIIYSLSMVAIAVTTAIEGIWTPWFTEHYINKDYKAINERAKLYLTLVAMIMLEIMFLAPEVLKIMTPSEYWQGIGLIPPLVMASYFIYMYSFFLNLELLEKDTKRTSLITLIAAVLNIGLNYIFIPMYGALAAAVTTLIAYMVSFGLHCVHGKRINKEVYNLDDFIKPIVILVVATIIFYFAIDLAIIRWTISIVVGLVLFKKLKCMR